MSIIYEYFMPRSGDWTHLCQVARRKQKGRIYQIEVERHGMTVLFFVSMHEILNPYDSRCFLVYKGPLLNRESPLHEGGNSGGLPHVPPSRGEDRPNVYLAYRYAVAGIPAVEYHIQKDNTVVNLQVAEKSLIPLHAYLSSEYIMFRYYTREQKAIGSVSTRLFVSSGHSPRTADNPSEFWLNRLVVSFQMYRTMYEWIKLDNPVLVYASVVGNSLYEWDITAGIAN